VAEILSAGFGLKKNGQNAMTFQVEREKAERIPAAKNEDGTHRRMQQARLTTDMTSGRFSASHRSWAQHQHPKFLIVRSYHAKSILDACFNGDVADG
jgi:hypothetical protein